LFPTFSVRLHSEGGVSFARFSLTRVPDTLVVPSPIILSFPCRSPSFHQLQIRKGSDALYAIFAFLPEYDYFLEFLMVRNRNLSNQLSHGVGEVSAR